MSFEKAKQIVTELSPFNWVLFLGWVVNDERIRRESIANQEKLISRFRDEMGAPKPDALKKPPYEVDQAPEWEDPKGDLVNFYDEGDIIQHDGKLWKSVYDGLNGEMPGVENTHPDFTPPWVEIAPSSVDGE